MPTRTGADRQPGTGITISSEQSRKPAAFSGVSIEIHADETRRYRL
ncbi:hypothetical protein C481_17007 [Natrialba asiatica DSM 12278]|uniref:Uncharacterized protein n=1 Tax=Natrialba asiatica (strain ATCC 700177 / DSM 12278 / JCM 9576 / FERM P-10747 / NBRC 102637 / 172P1) TaxID=29540 RepID=M0AJD7_NATA1|nr:hypothetical protein C481_17007 [Natrialba asiatica DSM 12278]